MFRPRSVHVLNNGAAQQQSSNHLAPAPTTAADFSQIDVPPSAPDTGTPTSPYDNAKRKLAAPAGPLRLPWAAHLQRASRRYTQPLLHLLLLLLVASLWLLHAHSRHQASQPRHLIVLDAGSTGTRVHVFRYTPDAGSRYAALVLPEPKFKVEPGLSAHASDAAGAGASLQPLLAFAAQHVPAAQRQATPVYLMATAGLRLLPEPQVDAILGACRSALSSSAFLFRAEWATVISGTNEGLYAWVAANYAAGHLQHAAEDAAHGRKDLHPHQPTRFKAIIELGGASAQVTFVPQQGQHHSGSSSNKHHVRLKLPGVHHPLWTHSYLGYGFDVVQAKVEALTKRPPAAGAAGGARSAASPAAPLFAPAGVVSQRTRDASGSVQAAASQPATAAVSDAAAVAAAPGAGGAGLVTGHPGAGGAGGGVSGGGALWDPCLPAGYAADGDGRVGSGVWTACQELVARVMDPSSCQPVAHTPCPEVPADMPRLTGELLAVENFAYTAHALSLPAESSLGEFAAAARAFCSRPWPQTVQAYRHEPEQARYLWRYCFGSAFAWTLLHQVLHISEGQRLHFTNALTRADGVQLGLDWALGAAVLQLSNNSAAAGAALARQRWQQWLLLAAAVCATGALLAALAWTWVGTQQGQQLRAGRKHVPWRVVVAPPAAPCALGSASSHYASVTTTPSVRGAMAALMQPMAVLPQPAGEQQQRRQQMEYLQRHLPGGGAPSPASAWASGLVSPAGGAEPPHHTARAGAGPSAAHAVTSYM